MTDAELHIWVEDATRSMRARAGSLLLVNPVTKELSFAGATGPQGRQAIAIRLQPGEGLAGSVAASGETLCLTDVSSDPRHSREVARLLGVPVRTMICVPIPGGPNGDTQGVLQFLNCLEEDELGDPRPQIARAERIAEMFQKLLAHPEERVTVSGTGGLLVPGKGSAEALARILDGFAITVVEQVDARDPYRTGHSLRVADFSLAIGRQMKLDAAILADLRFAGLLHDIGKMMLPQEILRKPERITVEEFDQIKTHVLIGDGMLASIPELQRVRAGVRSHHEKLDGTGYPDGLRDEEIPLIARIVAVADCFDAMTSTRAYRRAFSAQDTFERMESDMVGSHHDPEAFNGLLAAFADGQIQEQAAREQQPLPPVHF